MAYSAKLLHSFESCKSLAISTYESAVKREGREHSASLLTNLKKEYEGVINSPRTYEYINDLTTLFKVLEKRSEISPTNIHVLEYIYRVLNIKKQNLENHKTIIEENCNRRTHKVNVRGKDTKRQASNNNTTFNNSPHRYSSLETSGNINPDRHQLTERVVTEICTRVGSSWKDLARYLKVREYVIHAVNQDPKLASIEAKMRAILQEYEKRAFPEEMKIKLLNAFRLAERMDIHDDVQKLFLRET